MTDTPISGINFSSNSAFKSVSTNAKTQDEFFKPVSTNTKTQDEFFKFTLSSIVTGSIRVVDFVYMTTIEFNCYVKNNLFDESIVKTMKNIRRKHRNRFYSKNYRIRKYSNVL